MEYDRHPLKTHFFKKRFFFLYFFFILFCGIFPSRQAFPATPQRTGKIASADCALCHDTQRVLSPDHINTKNMTFSECGSCHKKNDKSLSGKIPLSHTHLLSGISCSDCHGDKKPKEALETDQCLSCHGSFEDLADKTASGEENPHDSPHYGTSLDCDMCHHIHVRSENFCNQCHHFDFTVP